MDRKVPLWVVLLIIFVAGIVTVHFGWVVQDTAKGGKRTGIIGEYALKLARYPAYIAAAYQEVVKNVRAVPNRFGVDRDLTYFGDFIDEGYLLASDWDEELGRNRLLLLELATGNVIHSWETPLEEITRLPAPDTPIPLPKGKQRIGLGAGILTEDGAIISGAGEGGALLKVDVCSNVEWIVNDYFHHDINQDAEGNIWIPSVIYPNVIGEKFLEGYRDDAIAKISPDGELLFKESISEILMNNGLGHLILGVGPLEKDAIHLNEIDPALTDGEYWKRGDLLVSLRHRSLIFLYRPETKEVLWYQLGPWTNQHDPDFIGTHQISVFGNDVTSSSYNRLSKEAPLITGFNDLYLVDLRSGETTTPYTELFKEADIRTVTGGQADILENGDVIVKDSNHGRLVRGSYDKPLWYFVNLLNDGTIARGSKRYFPNLDISVFEEADCGESAEISMSSNQK